MIVLRSYGYKGGEDGHSSHGMIYRIWKVTKTDIQTPKSHMGFIRSAGIDTCRF